MIEPEIQDGATPLRYSSPLIHERRRRILKEARKLIAEKGLENFGVRELCKRAEVAQRTLYNAFSSKERVAALAIKEAFDEIRYHVNYKTSATTVEGMIDRVITINSRNLKARNYALAVTSIYFSATAPRDVWDVLQKIGTNGITELLESLRDDAYLEDWVVIDEMALNFSNMTFAIINEWCMGRLDDEAYIRRMIEALLTLVIGATHGEPRETSERYLRSIRESGRIPEFPRPSWRVRASDEAIPGAVA